MPKILAAIDFSSVTDRVLEAAAELAGTVDSQIVLLHVIQIPVTRIADELATDELAILLAGLERDAVERLVRLTPVLGSIRVEALAAAGEPAQEILREARAAGADLIVLGSHGRTAAYEFLLGSTARGLMAACELPVILVPARRSPFPLYPEAEVAAFANS